MRTHRQRSFFFFFLIILSHLHCYMKRDTGFGFPDETRGQGRSRNGKCHSAIRCKLKGHSALAVAGETWLLWDRNAAVWLVEGGPRALRSVVGGGQHYGATRVSIEVLKLPIKKMDCVCVCVSRSSQSGFTNFYPTDLILCFLFLSWIQVDGRFLEKENIYTHTRNTKTLPLTLKLNDSH